MFQKRLQEQQQRGDQSMHVGPALLPLEEQQMRHEASMRDQLQPGKGEAGHGRGLQREVDLTVRS